MDNKPDIKPDPEHWVNLRRGQVVEVPANLGGSYELKICLVPARLSLQFMRAATDADPQTALEICCGYVDKPGALDWVDNAEIPRLLKLACELNFDACAAAAESQGAAVKRFLPALRRHLEAAKTMIEQEMSDTLQQWIKSQASAFAQPSSSGVSPKNSGKPQSPSSTPG